MTNYRYTVHCIEIAELNGMLMALNKDGWEVVSVSPCWEGSGAMIVAKQQKMVTEPAKPVWSIVDGGKP